MNTKRIGYVALFLAVTFVFWAFMNTHIYKTLALIALILAVLAFVLIPFNEREESEENKNEETYEEDLDTDYQI